MRRIAIAGILALCASCASAFQMKLPSQGRNWFEVKSDHFDLVTDLDEKAGAQLAGDASWAACRPDYVGDKGHHQLEPDARLLPAGRGAHPRLRRAQRPLHRRAFGAAARRGAGSHLARVAALARASSGGRPGGGAGSGRRELRLSTPAAYLAIAQGSCPAARALEEMAVERLPPPPRAREAEAISASRLADQFDHWAAMRERLADYRARCPAFPAFWRLGTGGR